MRRASRLITSLAAVAAFGQQPPAYELRAVLQPGMIIGNHSFDRNTIINAAAINDAGDVAFVAHWPTAESIYGHTSVFTLTRIVSNGQGFIDGKRLLSIAPDARVAISRSGLVAFEAFYDWGDAPGIFVERRYAVTPAELPDLVSSDFNVDDGGGVTMSDKPGHPSPLSPNRRGQIVIPINTPEGPYLFIGTPRTYAKAR